MRTTQVLQGVAEGQPGRVMDITVFGTKADGQSPNHTDDEEALSTGVGGLSLGGGCEVYIFDTVWDAKVGDEEGEGLVYFRDVLLERHLGPGRQYIGHARLYRSWKRYSRGKGE